jgi:hypothetical protein
MLDTFCYGVLGNVPTVVTASYYFLTNGVKECKMNANRWNADNSALRLASYLSFFTLLAFEKIPPGIHACSVRQMDGHAFGLAAPKKGDPIFSTHTFDP